MQRFDWARILLVLVLAGIPAGARGASMTATVQAVDVQNRTLMCLRGVGYAIRVEPIQIPERDLDAASIDPTTLVPGDLVHIHYRKTDEGSIATKIEKLPHDEGSR